MKLRRSPGDGLPATIRRRWRELTTYDIWNVGLVSLDEPLRSIDDLQLRDVAWLPPQPSLHFLADPFPFTHGGAEWLLVERYGHPKGVRGEICRVGPIDALRSKGSLAPEPVIRRERHVSYPCTFSDDGEAFCAPEMSQEDGCVFYRLERDGSWRPAHHVLRGRRLVDPTIFRFDGRWWMFAAAPAPEHNSVLNAFHAESIEGPWIPHERNPIKRDPGSARPAGRPFAIGARLFRPAQDCRRTYGGAVEVMEIVTLTPARFVEAHARRLEAEPGWPYPDGLHHLVVEGARVYFDAKRTIRDYLLPFRT